MIGGIITIWIATRDGTGLITDNYYQDGLEINRQLQQDQAAKVAEVYVTLTFSETEQQLGMTLAGNIPPPQTLELMLTSPVDPARDATFELTHTGDNHYQSPLRKMPAGRFYLRLTPDNNNWRLKGEVILPATGPVMIPAKPSAGQN